MDMDDLLENPFWILLIVAIIVSGIIVVAIILTYQPPEQGSSQLSFSLNTDAGKALETVPITVTIFNDGNKTTNVKVTLSSDAFGELTTKSVDVPAIGTKSTSPIDATIRDLTNKNYPITISYTYEGMSETPSETTEQFYVIPNAELFEVNYDRDIIQREIMHIQQRGQINLHFKVKSNSEASTYDGLYAILRVEETTHNFLIAPQDQDVEPIGPKGKTELPYSFKIEGNFTPVGKYHLTVVLYCNGHEVTSRTRTLDVI